MRLRIQIKNKNNSSWYYVDNDSILIENYNETLDSYQCRISHLTSKIDLDVLDNVILDDNDGWLAQRYMVVSSYRWIEESLDETTYQLELELCSETKKLEGCLCPNLSITPFRDDTKKRPILFYIDEYVRQYGERIRTTGVLRQYVTFFNPTSTGQVTQVLDYTLSGVDISTLQVVSLTDDITINSFSLTSELKLQVTYTATALKVCSIKINYTSTVTNTPRMAVKWKLSNNVMSRFANIVAPEKQWSEPTLREVLNDLMMVDDCIVVLKNDVIDYIDLTQIGSEISNYNYIQRSKDLNSYISELQMNMQNVLQTSVSGVKDTCLTVEYIPFTAEDYQIDSDNMIIKTKYPILNIKSLTLCGFTKAVVDDSSIPEKVNIRVKDFCNVDGYSLVKEYKEYQTLQVLYSKTFDSSDTGAYYSQYQNFCVYFVRNDKTITGFNNTTKKWKITNWTKTVWEWWKMITNGADLPSIDEEKTPYYDLFWKIEYETTLNQKFRASKGDVNNHRVIVDNQTNAWVDAYSQGNLEYQKANRLGNETVLINQRVEVGSSGNFTPIRIGYKKTETDGTLICYQTQYEILQDHIEVNAFLTKDYVLRDYFTGVNSKIRTWVNAKDEAFERQDLIKYYLQFSFTKKEEIAYIRDLASYGLTPINKTDVNYLKNVVVRTNGNNPSSTEWYSYDLVSRIIGNSIVFTFGFDDNTIAGRYIDVGASDIETYQSYFTNEIAYPYIDDSVLDELGGVPTKNYYYVDSNFETTSEQFQLVSSIDVSAGTYPTLTDNAELTRAESKNVLVQNFKLPKIDVGAVDSTKVIIGDTRTFVKDNKEIPTTTVQIEFTSDTQDIYFTDLWLQNQEAVRTTTKEALKYGKVPISSWRLGKKNYSNITELEDWYGVVTPQAAYNSSKLRIQIDDPEPEDLSSNFLVVYNSKGVLLAIRPDDEECTYVDIYLNFLRDRDEGIYNDNGIKYTHI